MLNEKEIKTLTDYVVHIAAGTNQHPHSVLVNSVRVFKMDEVKEKEIINKCKKILKSRADELPWSL